MIKSIINRRISTIVGLIMWYQLHGFSDYVHSNKNLCVKHSEAICFAKSGFKINLKIGGLGYRSNLVNRTHEQTLLSKLDAPWLLPT